MIKIERGREDLMFYITVGFNFEATMYLLLSILSILENACMIQMLGIIISWSIYRYNFYQASGVKYLFLSKP
jgi:hypothetical protein